LRGLINSQDELVRENFARPFAKAARMLTYDYPPLKESPPIARYSIS